MTQENSPLTINDKNIEAITQALVNGAQISDICNIDPETLENLYTLAYNLYTAKNYQDASVVFHSLCLYNNLEKRFWMGLAGCLQALKQYGQATEAYSMAGVVTGLTDPEPFLFAARCLVRIGRREDAIKTLEGVLEIGDATNPVNARTHMAARALLELLNK